MVLEQLKQAFPKANSAEKALNKYTAHLETLIFKSAMRERSIFFYRKGLYYLSLKALRDYGGRIGGQRKYIHEWLKENNLSLVNVIEKGSPFIQQFSIIKLSPLVTLSFDPNRATPQQMVAMLLDDYHTLSPQAIAQEYDHLSVDLQALETYIEQLSIHRPDLSPSKRECYLIQAVAIHKVATHFSGTYPQKKIHSFFGRTYYEGYSIQNVCKELRFAILGRGWDYDIRSCVVSWKLGFANDYMDKKGLTGKISDHFPYSHLYSVDKKPLINAVAKEVFFDDTYAPVEQRKLIKEAFTALNFGARLGNYQHVDEYGRYKTTALRTILHDPEELRRFNTSECVLGFKEEQDRLNQVIFNQFCDDHPQLLDAPEFRSKGGRLQRTKIMAYAFQHAETKVMNEVRRIAASHSLTVLAHIHDGLIFQKRLSKTVKAQMEQAMRGVTRGNAYWHLAGEKLQ